MTTITAGLVKELREKTGAGMMDCKTALTETGGDMEAAVDWLRAKGLSKAAKKAGRVAAEGLVGVATAGTKGAVVEINSETDFVARNTEFQDAVMTIAGVALDVGGDAATVGKADYPGVGKSVEDQLTSLIGTIGENMSLRRTKQLDVSAGAVLSYVHNAAAPGLGRMGVLVAIESDGDAAKLEDLGKKVAMHVAAANPLAVSDSDLDQEVVSRERAIFEEQARESGKPDNVIEKMVEGRLRKFFQEVVLLKQNFVMDPDKTVGQVVEDCAKEIGSPVTVKAFERYALGEGIEKDEADFAAEVAAAAKS